MRDTASLPDRYDESTLYEIRITGHLDDRWAEWFDGLSLTQDGDGTTILRGPLVDQAALYGVLKKVRNLALPLVSVTRVNREGPAVPEVDADAPGNRSKEEIDT